MWHIPITCIITLYRKSSAITELFLCILRYKQEIRPLFRLGKSGSDFSGLVPVTGLEPVRCCHRGILSPLRLPIPPHRHMCLLYNILRQTEILTTNIINQKTFLVNRRRETALLFFGEGSLLSVFIISEAVLQIRLFLQRYR